MDKKLEKKVFKVYCPEEIKWLKTHPRTKASFRKFKKEKCWEDSCLLCPNLTGKWVKEKK